MSLPSAKQAHSAAKPVRRPGPAAAKALITVSSAVATLAGWALLTAQGGVLPASPADPAPAAADTAAVAAPAEVAAPTPRPLPTLVPLVGAESVSTEPAQASPTAQPAPKVVRAVTAPRRAMAVTRSSR